MPKLSNLQNLAIDILDYLYFHDVALLSTFSKHKLSFYKKLLNEIDTINFERDHEDVQAEIYKHFLLCGIEILANYNNTSYDQSKKNHPLDVLDIIVNLVVASRFQKDLFLNDLHKIIGKFIIDNKYDDITYKLVAQIMYYEFDIMSLSVFKTFIDAGILSTEKYDCKLSIGKEDFFYISFLRAMLFIEFECFKRNFYIKYKCSDLFINRNILDLSINQLDALIYDFDSLKKIKEVEKKEYKCVISILSNLKKNMADYIEYLSFSLHHESLFLFNISDCINLNANLILCYFKETNLKRAIYYDREVNKGDNTCSDQASISLAYYGFQLKPRSISNKYNEFKASYRQIYKYFKDTSNKNHGLFTPELIRYFCLNKHSYSGV